MAKEAPSFILSIRFLLAILAFFAYAVQYTQKINMSVAIVCMIKPTDHHHHDDLNGTSVLTNVSVAPVDDQCGSLKKKSADFAGEFEWSKQMQGIILAGYFVGYLITEIPGGWLSLKFGSKIVLGVCLLVASLLTIVLPFAGRIHVSLFIICRFVIGAAHGVVWPAFSGFWSAWAPPSERSRLISISNAGAQIGNVMALPLGAFLCVNGFDGGWPSIFYVFGVFGVVWFVFWMIFASNKPSENRFISEREQEYVEEETRETMSLFKEAEKGAPWGKIMTNIPMLALFYGHTCSNWGTYLFLTSLPTYMKEVLKFDVKSNGALSALPYLSFWLFIISSGIIADKLTACGVRKIIVRKIFSVAGLIFPMIAVIGLMFVTCQYKYVGVAFLILGLATTGCTYGAGWLVNYNDIAGIYAGISFGIGNTFGTIPGIIAPYLVGVITKNKTQAEWQIVFGITAAVYLSGAIVMLIFQSTDIQPWARKKQTTAEEIPLNKEERA